MSMRRSRIKLKPNLAAKARGSGAPSAGPPVHGEGVKQEGADKDTLTAIKPHVEQHQADSPSVVTTSAQLVESESRTVTCISRDVPPQDVHGTVLTERQVDEGTQALRATCPIATVPLAVAMGPIVPAAALVGVSRITPVPARDERAEDGARRAASGGESDGGDAARPAPGTRIRSRFPKARPNLTAEAAIRGRIRTDSMSGQSDDESMRSPPALHRLTAGRPRQASVSEPTPGPQQLPVPGTEDSSPATPTVAPPPEVVRVPNNKNSLGIDMGCAIVKRVIKYERDEDGNRKKPKKLKWIDGPIDRSKITMRDLIHMNPMGKPMKSSVADKEQRRKQLEMRRRDQEKEDQEDGDQEDEEDDAASRVSAASLREERGVPAEDGLGDGPGDGVEGQAVPPATKPDPGADDEELTAVPQVRIGQNGEIILNESSLFIDNKDPDADSKAAAMELVHETDFTSYTFSYGRKTVSRLWSEMETKKFYLALSAVGTDFSLMGNLFPKRTRTELKRKFKREEKSNRFLVDKAIREQQHFDQEFFDNLRDLKIDESAPKRRQRKRKSPDDSEEDQENQAGLEKKKRRKSSAKVKVEKDADGTDKVKKKRGRPPKVKPTEEDEDEEGVEEKDEDTIVKPTRKSNRKRKGLTYVESDDEMSAVGCENEGKEPEPSCSGEADEPKVTKSKRGRKPKTPKAPAEVATKPKRKQSAKAPKDANVDTVPDDILETEVESGQALDGHGDGGGSPLVVSQQAQESFEEASYVFVASSPRPDAEGGAAEPVIHVYLVSPSSGDRHQPPKDAVGTEVTYPSTPCSVRSPPAVHDNAVCSEGTPTRAEAETASVPEEKAKAHEEKEEAATSIVECPLVGGSEEEPVTISITEPEEATEVFLIVKDDYAQAVTIKKSVEFVNDSETPQATMTSNVADMCKQDTLKSPVLATTSVDVVSSTTTSMVSTPIVGSSMDLGGSLPEVVGNESPRAGRHTDLEGSPSRVAHNKPPRVRNCKDLGGSPSKVVHSKSPKAEKPKELGVSPPRIMRNEPPKDGGSKDLDFSKPKAGNDMGPIVSIKDVDVVSAKDIDGKVGVANTPGASCDKGLGLKGRRRRITAMPKIPVGKRRPARPAAQADRSATNSPKDTSELPPIDDLTASDILLEMSHS